MVKLIEADTRLDAWMEGVEFLLENGPSINLILAIGSPIGNGSLSVADRCIDKFLQDEKELPMHTVAETSLPRVAVSETWPARCVRDLSK